MKTLWGDRFAGQDLSAHWVAGHLNLSPEVRLWIDDGVHIEFDLGDQYASAGLVTRVPIDGDFRALVRFAIDAPAKGSTLELAAVSATPPALSHFKPQDPSQTALIFNVHGEPPYASSEFDEDDGWRLGWNWHPPEYEMGPGGEIWASNKYNRYSPSQSPQPMGEAQGWLMLERRDGRDWLAQRRSDTMDPWQPVHAVTGTALPGPVHLRLLAKHWVKKKIGLESAPANRVFFGDFELQVWAQ